MEICLAVIFIGTNFKNKPNVAAVFEWIIALVFTFYVLTFFIDLLPAFSDKQHVATEQDNMEEYRRTYGDGAGGGGDMVEQRGTVGGYDTRTTTRTTTTMYDGNGNGNGNMGKDGPMRRDF